jgi:hypothetical protein
MASYEQIVTQLKKQEQRLLRELSNIKTAIAALKSDDVVSPVLSGKRRIKVRRRFSKETRAKMAAAQKARWAKQKAARK